MQPSTHLQERMFRAAKQLFLLYVLLFCNCCVFSQFKVRFRLVTIPPGHLQDSVFIAGNFNDWNPGKNGNAISLMKKDAFIEINNMPSGPCQFKFTRGSWQSTESKSDGKDIDNRQQNISSDTTLTASIEGWKDDFAATGKHHTASPNVQLMDAAFPMPELGRTRRIWLYLPPGYAKSRKRYPVMYMQDGQNIFDEYTAAFGEWGVDKTIDSMVENGQPGCMVVGIENGPKRMTEYNPYEFKDLGKGEGDAYVDFIVRHLKPYVDAHYRTLATRSNTIIAGSSMGGLISYYAMLKYPEVFGKAGIFSPAFWTAGKIKDLTESRGKDLNGALFFYIGGKEGEKFIADMVEIAATLKKNSKAFVYSVTDPTGEHNEQAWRKWFPVFYNLIMTSPKTRHGLTSPKL